MRRFAAFRFRSNGTCLWACFLQIYFRSVPSISVIIFFLSHFISGLSMWKSIEWRNTNHMGSPKMHLHSVNHNFWTGNSHLSEMGFPGGASDKEPICQCRRHKRRGFSSCVGKIPWRRAWQPTPGLLPGEFHGQRSLVGHSRQGRKELDTTEAT